MLEGHTEYVRAVVISTDGAKIVSGGDDKSVRFWSMETGEVQPAIQPASQLVVCSMMASVNLSKHTESFDVEHFQ